MIELLKLFNDVGFEKAKYTVNGNQVTKEEYERYQNDFNYDGGEMIGRKYKFDYDTIESVINNYSSENTKSISE